ncbi:MAG: hypothetical protein SD837_11715 [Candidatus Electrothrix scaldis]|nr:MAG: hypothetical protein SD837_11715 [Candidatus Electrothrix sp. GW3-3]
MKTHGGLHTHRGLIALTGAFFAAFALSGCGHEKPIDPQAELLPEQNIERAFQKQETLTAGRTFIAPVLRESAPAEEIHLDPPTPVAPPKAETELTLSAPHPSQCWMGDVTNPLREVVTSLEEQSLLYNTGPLTDCSGIFHRVLQGLKEQCPGRDFPTVEKDRDSRALARWYHERGKLQLIDNAEESAALLKPGAIIFFGRNGSVYEDFSVDDLLTPRKGIAHLGVVVKVHKDKSGKVLHYELFHGYGRKGITAASVTDWHKRTPTRNGYPPFGNGRQQWVAVARI